MVNDAVDDTDGTILRDSQETLIEMLKARSKCCTL